MEPFPRASAVA